MKCEGILKKIETALATGGNEVSTKVQLEIFGDAKSLHDLMQEPLLITFELMPKTFGRSSEKKGRHERSE